MIWLSLLLIALAVWQAGALLVAGAWLVVGTAFTPVMAWWWAQGWPVRLAARLLGAWAVPMGLGVACLFILLSIVAAFRGAAVAVAG